MANNLTKIIAGLLIAIAILLGVYAWMLGRKPGDVAPVAATVATQSVPVVVTTRPLQAGQPIPADALKVQQSTAAPQGAFADPLQLVGRTPAADIPAQAAVVASALSSGLAEQIAPGERAVAIKVDETNAVGNRVRPGNYVDVFLNLKRDGTGVAIGGTSTAEIVNTQARLLMSKVRVLSFGDATTERDSSNGSVVGTRTAVLAVPTAQVDALTLAEQSGRLVLALRNPRDDDVATQTVAVRVGDDKSPSTLAAAGVVLGELSKSATTAAPAPRAVPRVVARHPSGGSIEVIRGGRTETVAY
ncbi:TPA: Flp pilus assembly protein CpaB [Burkholderia cenocepacia]|jgi:pilus assembly protein CpaB|uniref:Flp pilus assembly protein CpaB n=2 Tax=Burkholderia cenocepacia TaxID=95486 RepID=A0A142PFP6_9BURK|nr:MULTISPECIES: Flp pilus assembly protein CpaB [Burkholderia]AIO47163.1 Flp pilus assembly protein CpaB [Burkholderia cepacia]ALV55419.1 pilus assembly protein CpaB [Burkholderia cenocepacia]AMU14917.1 Flp pilus assembly protein CpaB [Burkholderia cenocepacia]AOK34193.1 Flp pilus assembly protein CpaB [Burkholderia cenocepacia]AQQ42401.1 Flp pilus assembly protein CpaB [Burkholderia cenocepacia]